MTQRIRVRHPGYTTPNTLFTFPAADGTNQDHAHFAMIWMVCLIFTNNRQDHWLSSSPKGEPKVTADANNLLCAGDYYLHMPVCDDDDTSRPFPVVPNFRAWRYPHDILPSLWTQASQSNVDRACSTDFSNESITVEHCRITKRKLKVDNAHIIPVSEKLWFTNNEMGEYGDIIRRSGEIIADSFANLMRLRCDAHRLWDKLSFSIVPRGDHTTRSGAAWFTQALGDSDELHKYWHHQRLESLTGRPPQYLLARFAWDIFPKLHQFLQAGQERQLTVWTLDGRAETRRYSGLECRRFTIGQGQNRSASPTKRARSESSTRPKNPEEAQCGKGSQTPEDSFTSSHVSGSDGADSAVAGLPKFHKTHKDERDTAAEQDWYDYICGFEDRYRGRKRLKVWHT